MSVISPETITDEQTDTEGPNHAHIIDRGDDPRDAIVIVMEARINGTPLTALCGYIWVPHRDPDKLPLCERCKEMFAFAQDFRS